MPSLPAKPAGPADLRGLHRLQRYGRRPPFAGDYTNDPNTYINEDETLENDNIGATLTLNKDFGNLSLLSVTSYQEYDRWQPKESDATPGLYVDFLFTQRDLGLLPGTAPDLQFRRAVQLDCGGQLLPGRGAELPGRIGYLDDFPPSPGRAELTYEQDRKNLAAYAQATWELAEQWRLSAGGRGGSGRRDLRAERHL